MRTENVLCPVDFSQCSEVALRTAAAMTRESGGSLTLVNVYGIGRFSAGEAVMAVPDATAELRADAELALSQAKDQALALHAPRVATVAVMGVAWDQIVKLAASTKADLIVMGTHGRTGISHALIGSVAERVVRHAPCSVLVVRKG